MTSKTSLANLSSKESRDNLKNKNQLVLKRQVFSSDDPEKKPLEKSIVISTPGSLKKINVLRPLRSQYTVWFEKKKYFTEMKLDVKKKSLEVRMVSPEKQWNGVKHVSFPRGKGVYCFFSQVVDCVALTGFINEAVKREAGEMYFHLIWEGYPYFMEQYLNIKEEVFTRATFKYDGKTGDGHFRFTLEAGGQSLFLSSGWKLIHQKTLLGCSRLHSIVSGPEIKLNLSRSNERISVSFWH